MHNPLLQRKIAMPAATERLDSLYTLLSSAQPGDEETYQQARTELNDSVAKMASQIPSKTRLGREVRFAKWDILNAKVFAGIGDFKAATGSQLHAVWRLRNIVGALGNKTAYGYDISGEAQGEMFNGSKDIANRENQKNIDDTAEPWNQHETENAPQNLTRDFLAEQDYPSLREKKNKRIHWPARVR
jgi:hypothetical protein